MGYLVGALLGALIQGAGSLVGRVLISLGIGYATYAGMDASITWAKDQALLQLSGLGADVVRVAGLLQIGTAISILTSAMLGRLVLNGLTGGVLKKMVVR